MEFNRSSIFCSREKEVENLYTHIQPISYAILDLSTNKIGNALSFDAAIVETAILRTRIREHKARGYPLSPRCKSTHPAT